MSFVALLGLMGFDWSIVVHSESLTVFNSESQEVSGPVVKRLQKTSVRYAWQESVTNCYWVITALAFTMTWHSLCGQYWSC